jgi:23S rRNA (cytidine1920-2'-O)/16S rRNA (cytidine1409-2'-O)-methyltransferase
VRRGIAPTIEEARRSIDAGEVLIDGAPAVNAATMVDGSAGLRIRADGPAFASRGGMKLRAALDRFQLDPTGSRCLDAGASTGGFTDCLLQAGAAHVVAVDVGYGQLAWSLRSDDRVTVLERTNVRTLEAADVAPAPTFVAADLSFISLRSVIPALRRVASEAAVFVLLVKPQFEVEPERLDGGVVREPATWHAVLDAIVALAGRETIEPLGVMASPLRGPAGNVEFLLYGRVGMGAGQPIDVDRAVQEGVALG